MSEPEKPIQLGLSSEANSAIPQAEYVPAPESLQFRKAEHASASSGPPCVLCKKPIGETYYHANGQVVCPTCAQAIQAGQNVPPAHTLLKSLLYGLGAAIAGTAIFATVWILTGYQLALISILIGFMVGKAIRYASNGLGGRPQQVLAVALTYFSITASFIPVFIHEQMQKPTATQTSQPTQAQGEKADQGSFGMAIVMLIGVAMAAPFMSLGSGGFGGILTLLIIFFGLQRAWRMTGRHNVLVVGPYQQAT